MPRVDSEKLYAHIKSKAGRVKCPVCRRGPMTFSDRLNSIPELFDRPNLNQKVSKAVIALECENCGGVSLIDPFSAGIGIIDDEEPTNDTKELK